MRHRLKVRDGEKRIKENEVLHFLLKEGGLQDRAASLALLPRSVKGALQRADCLQAHCLKAHR
jgi:hypothetical protein